MRALAFFVAALVACSTGCARAPAPVDRHFQLPTVPAAASLPTPGIEGTLLVDRPQGDALLAQRRIVVRRDVASPELSQHAYALWTDVPTSMVQHAISDHLRSSGVAGEVVTTDLGARGDFLLRGRLLRFEHVEGREPEAAVDLELFLTHRDTGRLVMQGRYATRRALPGSGMTAVAEALGLALGEALDGFVADLAARPAAAGLLAVPANPAP